MVRQFQNITDSYNWIIQQTDRKLDTILVINPYRRDTSLVATQYLIVQRLDLVQGLNTRCRLQCFDSLLVPLDDVWLEPMLFVGCLAFIVQFFKILLFKCYYHDAKIHKNVQKFAKCRIIFTADTIFLPLQQISDTCLLKIF